MRTLIALTPLLLVCLFAQACSDDASTTGVDLETPVTDLAGWDTLVTDLGLTPERAGSLERWVETFRTGLDISRSDETESARLENEVNWWAESERSLEALVGAEDATRVLAWLEERFERRAGER